MTTSDFVNASELNVYLTRVIAECGERAGFTVVREYAVSGGRIDVMWLWQPPTPIPGLESAVPVVGFEIESSWRTRKHIKGDMVNLLDAGCALGVIVCAGDTAKDEALRTFARSMVDRPGPTILIWTADDVERLRRGEVRVEGAPPPPPGMQAPEASRPGRAVEHGGKYRPLWQWLRERPDRKVTVSFAEIEAAIGMPLPPSCRRHVAHWHSYEGSAVARAIGDAGWRASNVDLTPRS